MHQPLIKRQAVYTAYSCNAPFKVHLTYEGWTSNGNPSHKWWSLSYDGTPGGLVECNHGKLGASGRTTPFRYDIWKALDKLEEKLGKGYLYAPGTSDAVPMGKTTPPPKAPKKGVLPPPFDSVVSVRRVFDEGRFVWQAEDDKGGLVATLNDTGAAKLRALMGIPETA
jgi:hypothetical protein